jgi:hypothetical protein
MMHFLLATFIAVVPILASATLPAQSPREPTFAAMSGSVDVKALKSSSPFLID